MFDLDAAPIGNGLSALLDAPPNLLADRLSILQLISLYSHLVDDLSPELWGEIFCEDARFEIQFSGGEGDDSTVLEGRQAILAVILPRQRSFREKGIQRRHYLTNPAVIDQNDDSARVMAYLQLASIHPERGLEIEGTGRYDGIVVRTPDGWRIKQWRLVADGKGGKLTSDAS